MPARVWVRALIVLFLATAGAAAQEYNTDRPGRDYRDFDLPAADFNLCRRACAREDQCQAWTYVDQDNRGSEARCYLKSGVPDPVRDECCISGVKSVSTGDSEDRCRDYATRAVSQNDENLRRRCGFAGERWQSNRTAHFEWCLGVREADRVAENRTREDQLTRCRAGGEDVEEQACRDYAQEAVDAARQNIRLACGQDGDRWSTVYTRHYNWCRTATRAERDTERRARGEALRECRAGSGGGDREDACRDYAEEAVQQNGENRRLGCNLTGGRWTSDYNRHFNFCMSAGREARAEESDARRRALRRCREAEGGGGDRAEACRDYAAEAVAQQRENRRLSCNFTGARWQSSSATHYEWCMNASREERQAESRARARDLLHCREDTADGGEGPECEDYARSALRDARRNRELRCGFDGRRWSRDGETHFEWCSAAPPAARAKEAERRRALLGICAGNPAKAAVCRNYGNTAVEQHRINLAQGCGFSGPRWHSNYEDHFVFCMGAPKLVRKIETVARGAALATCQ